MASKRRLRRKGCTGKHVHADQARAVAHAIALNRTRIGRDRVHAYRCAFGSHWHVGHRRGR